MSVNKNAETQAKELVRKILKSFRQEADSETVEAVAEKVARALPSRPRERHA